MIICVDERTQRELRRVTPNKVYRDAPAGGKLKTREVSLKLSGSGEKKGANSRNGWKNTVTRPPGEKCLQEGGAALQ